MTILKKMDLLLLALAREISMADLKAIVNLFVIPFTIAVVSNDFSGVLLWLGLCVGIYTTIKKDTDNARAFLGFIKNIVSIGVLIGLVSLFLIFS